MSKPAVVLLVAALQEYMRLYPAFRSKPIGAPYSEAREQQDEQIAAEDAALAAIRAATS